MLLVTSLKIDPCVETQILDQQYMYIQSVAQGFTLAASKRSS